MTKIIHHDGLGFVVIPKAGGSSIKTAIRDAMGLDQVVGIHADPRLNFTNSPEGLFTVAFIRNPFDRLVSAWADKIHSPSYIERRLGKHGFRLNMPFDEFVRHVDGHCFDAHIQPQKKFLPVSVDLIARFERMADVWPKLQSRFSWLPDLPHKNRSERGRWEDMYTPELLQIVERVYAEDIALWRSLSA